MKFLLTWIVCISALSCSPSTQTLPQETNKPPSDEQLYREMLRAVPRPESRQKITTIKEQLAYYIHQMKNLGWYLSKVEDLYALWKSIDEEQTELERPIDLPGLPMRSVLGFPLWSYPHYRHNDYRFYDRGGDYNEGINIEYDAEDHQFVIYLESEDQDPPVDFLELEVKETGERFTFDKPSGSVYLRIPARYYGQTFRVSATIGGTRYVDAVKVFGTHPFVMDKENTPSLFQLQEPPEPGTYHALFERAGIWVLYNMEVPVAAWDLRQVDLPFQTQILLKRAFRKYEYHWVVFEDDGNLPELAYYGGYVTSNFGFQEAEW